MLFIPKNITFGSDFECFIKDRKSGKIVPPSSIFTGNLAKRIGTKEEPVYHHHVSDKYKEATGQVKPLKFGAQIDCCTIEFTVEPQKTLTKLISTVAFLTDYNYLFYIKRPRHTTKVMNLILGSDNYQLYPDAIVNFEEEDLKDPICNTFGCSPEFNVLYPGKEFVSQPNQLAPGIRTAGVHLHIGYDNANTPEGRAWGKRFILALDYCRKTQALHETSWSLNNIPYYRRDLYSNHSTYREKPYGLEYRGFELANFCVDHAYKAIIAAIGCATFLPEFFDASNEKILEYWRNSLNTIYKTGISYMEDQIPVLTIKETSDLYEIFMPIRKRFIKIYGAEYLKRTKDLKSLFYKKGKWQPQLL